VDSYQTILDRANSVAHSSMTHVNGNSNNRTASSMNGGRTDSSALTPEAVDRMLQSATMGLQMLDAALQHVQNGTSTSNSGSGSSLSNAMSSVPPPPAPPSTSSLATTYPQSHPHSAPAPGGTNSGSASTSTTPMTPPRMVDNGKDREDIKMVDENKVAATKTKKGKGDGVKEGKEGTNGTERSKRQVCLFMFLECVPSRQIVLWLFFAYVFVYLVYRKRQTTVRMTARLVSVVKLLRHLNGVVDL